jgi:hypothetical protein
MTAEDLHLLLYQTGLSEKARALAGVHPVTARQEVVTLIHDALTRAGQWREEEDVEVLRKFMEGTSEVAEVEAHFAERL